MKNPLPENIEAEKAVIAFAVTEGLAADRVLEKLAPEQFSLEAHQIIMSTIAAMRQVARPVDLLLVTSELENAGVLEKIGGAFYFTEIYTEFYTHANWDIYAGMVLDAWKRRAMRQAALAMAEAANDYALTTEDAQERCEQALYALRDHSTRENPVSHCKNAVLAAVEHIENVHRHRGETVGLTTGVHDLDRSTGGFLGGQMIVIAARPACGKSALGMQIALHSSMEKAVPTLVFSVEMPSQELMVRAICSEAHVDLQRVRDGFFKSGDLNTVSAAATRLTKTPLYLDDTPGLTVAQFRSRARRAKAQHNIGLIVVDYLQFMAGSSKRAGDSRALEVSEISRAIKQTAKELDIPIVALAQLNRDAEESAKPKLSNLRESGSIEQDADIVLLIHRLDKNKKRDEEDEPLEYNTLLIVAKIRNGKSNDIKLNFKGEHTVFQNITEKLYSNNQNERQK